MLFDSQSRADWCPRCLSRTLASTVNEKRSCPLCGNRNLVSAIQFGIVACVLVAASYGGGMWVVYLITRDVARFMLPGLEAAFILLLLSVRILFPRLPLTIRRPDLPRAFRSHLRHGSLLARH